MTDNLYHKTPTIEDMADYRIASIRDKTNILIRVCTAVIGRENEVLEFTGVLSPDSTGDFTEVCTLNGQPYYHNAGENWYLWWHPDDSTWVVGKTLGGGPPAFWAAAEKISNNYMPYGTATGIGDMHTHP